jgi:hypothetical protein
VTGLFGRHGCHDLSSDGEMFCTLTRLNHTNTKAIYIVAYDKNGIELWSNKLAGDWPPYRPCVAVSPTYKYVFASTDGNFLFNKEGNLIGSYPYSAEKPKFSADDKYVLIGCPRDTICLIQSNNGDIVWKKFLGGQPHSDPYIAKDGRVIFYADGYLLNKNGDIIWQDKNAVKNAMGISPSGHLFIPTSNPDVIIYRISSEAGNEDH